MSLEYHVFLPSSAGLRAVAWNAALRDLALPVVLDEFKPSDQTGFLPALCKDQRSGFELYFCLPTEIEESYGVTAPPGMTATASFRLGGDLRELAAALSAAAALCARFQGKFFDPQKSSWMAIDELVTEARVCLDSL